MWISKFQSMYRIGQKGIYITAVWDRLIDTKNYDDDFRSLFSFLLGRILYHTSATYTNPMYPHALKDIRSIGKKNELLSASTFYGVVHKCIEKQEKSVNDCLIFLKVCLTDLKCNNYFFLIFYMLLWKII